MIFIHALLGFNVSVPDEIIVKWFEFAHFWTSNDCTVSNFWTIINDRQRKEGNCKIYSMGIVYGYSSKPMLNVYFERKFEMDLNCLKRNWE